MNENAIEIRGLVKRYPSFQLGPLDLDIPRGSIYGLIGPNGAGKTTALDLILGMGRNDCGDIHIFGLDHQRDGVKIKQRTGYVGPELNFQAWGSVGRAIRFVRGFFPNWDDTYCTQLMKTLQLSDNTRISTLSFGAKTKLSLLLALSHRPELLILDEPTTGLDAFSKQQIFAELLKVVENGERTVLVSSHALADIERFADHVSLLNHGRLLLQGRMDEVIERFRLAEFFMKNEQDVPPREGFIVLKRNESRWQAVVDQKNGIPGWLQGIGAQNLALTPMTLEDLFVALVRGKESE